MNIIDSIPQILSTIEKHHYQKVVLQVPKCYLPAAFQLTRKLRQQSSENVQFYTLFDSLKKQCCTDILGAKHVNYDGLFHFGLACFSEKYQPNHHYLLPAIPQEKFNEEFKDTKSIHEKMKQLKIQLVICGQSMYSRFKEREKEIIGDQEMQILRLPFDQVEGDEYFGFSYYGRKNILQKENKRNIAVFGGEEVEELLENLALCKKSLNIHSIYTYNGDFAQYNKEMNVKLMQRISQSSKIETKEIFGILVSNPSTEFCQKQILKCRNILEKRKLKNFTFMMNNLNECKLGNFPEIQVYILISCYNHSLYTSKDFHHLVVTPFDLEMVFGEASLQNYNFDLKVPQSEVQIKEEMVEIQKKENFQSSLSKYNNEIMVRQAIQTLDFYRAREYKGLDFSEKKQIKKMTKGKIGLAEKYEPLDK